MKLHLGCGKRFIPGFEHIDAVEYPHVRTVHAIDALPFIANDSVDLIYACHVLEHFTKREALRVLSEWRRVLLPGGILRVAVPDFAALAKVYLSGQPLDRIHGPLFGRGDYLYNIHYAVYDEETLTSAFIDAGFSSWRRYDWHETEHADVDDFSQAYLPHLDRENGTLISLNMEATK